MQNDKFQTGAFVFTRARGLEPRDPEELHPLAEKHGVSTTVIPGYAGDRTAIGRAITQTQSGLAKEGFLLRPIKRSSTEVVYGIVREQKDEAGQRLDHDFEATVSWTAEPDPEIVRGRHPIAQRVADAYQALRGKIVADDWSSAITAYLESNDAARVRGDGRVYWVPPQRLDAIRRLGTLLQDVGIDLILCELEPEVRTIAQDVAHHSLEEQLDHLQAEVEQFDGTQKPSTYARRLEEYQKLRDRAVLYRDALGVGVDRAEAVLSELEHKVSSMLDLRRKTVIPRNNPDVFPDREPAGPHLRFGGATFHLSTDNQDPATLCFVSDEEAAKSAAARLETLGMAGRWQQAGPARVAIQNSGPAGAAVSIRIALPDTTDLGSVAAPLSAMGIELSR